jgi:hypothetical protein
LFIDARIVPDYTNETLPEFEFVGNSTMGL